MIIVYCLADAVTADQRLLLSLPLLPTRDLTKESGDHSSLVDSLISSMVNDSCLSSISCKSVFEIYLVSRRPELPIMIGSFREIDPYSRVIKSLVNDERGEESSEVG